MSGQEERLTISLWNSARQQERNQEATERKDSQSSDAQAGQRRAYVLRELALQLVKSLRRPLERSLTVHLLLHCQQPQVLFPPSSQLTTCSPLLSLSKSFPAHDVSTRRVG